MSPRRSKTQAVALCLTAAALGACGEPSRPSILSPAGDAGDAAAAGPDARDDAGADVEVDVGPIDVSCPVDEPTVEAEPRDRWSAALTFRERTLHPDGRPAAGWLVVPLHGNLLPDGRVLLHGELKDYNGPEADREHHLIASDAQWIVDPASPEPTADGDLEVHSITPWQRWASDPNGTHTDPSGRHGGGISTEILVCGGQTWLADGSLLYAGGTAVYANEPSQPHPPADDEGMFEGGHWKTAILDPTAGVDDGAGWRVGPPMLQGMRYYPSATRLPDGDVLVVSGLYDTSDYDHTGIERLDTRSMTWREWVPSLGPVRPIPSDDPRAGLPPHPEDYPHTFVLPSPLASTHPAAAGLSREVLVIGRRGDVSLVSTSGGEGTARVARVEAWRRPGDLGDPTDERMHGASSVLLSDGTVAVFAGSDSAAIGGRVDTLQVSAMGPSLPAWRSTPLCEPGGRCHARVHGMAVLTPGPEVLLLAGRPTREGAAGDPRVPLYVDPITGSVREGSPWPDESWRGYHTVVVTARDGRLLVAGGRNYEWSRCDRYGVRYCEDERPDMRWYSPAWLDPSLAPFRPRITAPPTDAQGAQLPRASSLPTLTLGGRFRAQVATDRPAGCATAMRAVLLGLPAQTHAFDMNQRRVPLASTPTREGIEFQLPASASELPPGPYQLVVVREVRVRSSGATVHVPSVAQTVLVR